MEELCDSKTIGDVSFLLQLGWLPAEINTYIPYIDSLTDNQLLQLHNASGIKMFSSENEVNREQAILVLLNPDDISKENLIALIKKQVKE